MIFTRQHIIFKFISAIIISLLFVTPFMVSDEIYNGVIMAKEFWFFGVVALMLLYTAVQLIIKKEKIRIEFNLIDILLLTFYTWCFIRAIFTPYTPFYHNHKLQILTGMMVVYFFVKNAIKNENNVRNEGNENNKFRSYSFIPSFFHSFINKPFILSFLIFSFILSGFLQAIYGLLQLYGVYPSHHNLYRITGSFFNPAPYAMYLAVVFSVALGKALFNEENENNTDKENKGKITERNNSFISSFFHSFIHPVLSFIAKYLPIATVIAILLVLPATMNRASWLGAAAGSLVVLQYRYNWWGQVKHWINTRTKKVIAITGTILVVSGICISLIYLKAGSSNGRLFIWEVTLGKIAEKPLFGHGLGRFEAEYNNWQAEYFMKHPEEMDGPKGWVAGNTRYAFNEFLEIGSEIGMVGLLLLLEVIGFVFIRSHSFVNKSHLFASRHLLHETQTNDDQRSNSNIMIVNSQMAIFFTPSLFSFLIISVISFPLYSLPTGIIFFMLTGVLSLNVKQYTIELPASCQASLTIPIITVVLAAVAIVPLRKMSHYKTWCDATFMYRMGNYTEANNEYKKCVSKLTCEGLLWQQYGKSLQMAGQNRKAIDLLKKAKLLRSDQVLYTTLGEAYNETKQYKMAESNFQFSLHMQPHKLYPQYLLAKLYVESGDKQKAIAKANEILNSNAKTESMAVEEIKLEMKKLIMKVSKL